MRASKCSQTTPVSTLDTITLFRLDHVYAADHDVAALHLVVPLLQKHRRRKGQAIREPGPAGAPVQMLCRACNSLDGSTARWLS